MADREGMVGVPSDQAESGREFWLTKEMWLYNEEFEVQKD